MCATCGCSAAVHEHPVHPERSRGALDGLGPNGESEHHHAHGDHAHGHEHLHPEVEPRLIKVERDVLARNEAIAGRLKGWLDARGILALNLLSSPGSGKTTLLEKTIAALKPELPLRVIEGDQETSRDADRIRAAGAEALQINTGTACHLDAQTVERAVQALAPPPGSVLFIENVGNLVCPAMFDLGERAKVVVASVTEGDDKPLKYPHMFRACDLVLLNKLDLLPHVPFSVEAFERNVERVHPGTRVLGLSALNGVGVDAWLGWVREQRRPSVAEARL